MIHRPESLVVVFGPTGVGKTRLGVSLSQYLNGEVISVDSLQCYKTGAILTAQPLPTEKDRVPHHLVGYLDSDSEPHHTFVGHALQKIQDIKDRGRLPIIVGGSTSLTAPLLSEVLKQNIKPIMITLTPSVYEDSYSSGIQARIDEMVAMGLLDEVRQLKLPKNQSPIDYQGNKRGVWKAIGYPELEPFLDHPEDSQGHSIALQAGLALMKSNTLLYALTQLNWIKQKLIPLAQLHGIRVLDFGVNVSGQNWSKEVEVPAICECSKFCSRNSFLALKAGDVFQERVTLGL